MISLLVTLDEPAELIADLGERHTYHMRNHSFHPYPKTLFSGKNTAATPIWQMCFYTNKYAFHLRISYRYQTEKSGRKDDDIALINNGLYNQS